MKHALTTPRSSRNQTFCQLKTTTFLNVLIPPIQLWEKPSPACIYLWERLWLNWGASWEKRLCMELSYCNYCFFCLCCKRIWILCSRKTCIVMHLANHVYPILIGRSRTLCFIFFLMFKIKNVRLWRNGSDQLNAWLCKFFNCMGSSFDAQATSLLKFNCLLEMKMGCLVASILHGCIKYIFFKKKK